MCVCVRGVGGGVEIGLCGVGGWREDVYVEGGCGGEEVNITKFLPPLFTASKKMKDVVWVSRGKMCVGWGVEIGLCGVDGWRDVYVEGRGGGEEVDITKFLPPLFTASKKMNYVVWVSRGKMCRGGEGGGDRMCVRGVGGEKMCKCVWGRRAWSGSLGGRYVCVGGGGGGPGRGLSQ